MNRWDPVSVYTGRIGRDKIYVDAALDPLLHATNLFLDNFASGFELCLRFLDLLLHEFD